MRSLVPRPALAYTEGDGSMYPGMLNRCHGRTLRTRPECHYLHPSIASSSSSSSSSRRSRICCS
jgi:hypothetical protein